MQFINNRQLKEYGIGALQPALLRRSIIIALVVGTLLNVINQGEVFFSLEVDIVKVVLTYLVPFCVSTISGSLAYVACSNKLNNIHTAKINKP